MYLINIYNTLFIPNAPSILMYKMQIISFASIFFRLVYLGLFFIYSATYIYYILSALEYSLV